MLALTAGDTIAGVADAATDVTYTITGDLITTTDSYQAPAQGQLPAAAATLYTVPGSTQALLNIALSNQSAAQRTVTIYKGGTGNTNVLFNCVIPPFGSAGFDGVHLEIRDSTGALLSNGTPLGSLSSASVNDGMIWTGTLWAPASVVRALGTPATAAGALTASSANVVSGTLLQLVTNQLVIGNRFRWTIGLDKTAAGTATWAAAVKFGTNGTTADAAIATWTSGTNTGAIDQAILIIEMVVTAIGGTATATCIAFYCNTLTNVTGLGKISPAPTPTATFNAGAASPFIHVDVTPGASAVMTGWGMVDQTA